MRKKKHDPSVRNPSTAFNVERRYSGGKNLKPSESSQIRFREGEGELLHHVITPSTFYDGPETGLQTVLSFKLKRLLIISLLIAFIVSLWFFS